LLRVYYPFHTVLPLRHAVTLFHQIKTMKPFLKSLLTALLILLFVYAAVSKLAAFQVFRQQLYRQAIPKGIADVLLYLLPFSELAAVALLFIQRTCFTGLMLSLALLVLFTGYVALTVFHFWDSYPCSCGGILGHMPWRVHLVFNLAFLIINIAAIRLHLEERRAVT
jgi:putative oxidoreductase